MGRGKIFVVVVVIARYGLTLPGRSCHHRRLLLLLNLLQGIEEPPAELDLDGGLVGLVPEIVDVGQDLFIVVIVGGVVAGDAGIEPRRGQQLQHGLAGVASRPVEGAAAGRRRGRRGGRGYGFDLHRRSLKKRRMRKNAVGFFLSGLSVAKGSFSVFLCLVLKQ